MKLNANYIQFSLFHFLPNQKLKKIVLTSSHKIHSKENQKNYTPSPSFPNCKKKKTQITLINKHKNLEYNFD